MGMMVIEDGKSIRQIKSDLRKTLIENGVIQKFVTTDKNYANILAHPVKLKDERKFNIPEYCIKYSDKVSDDKFYDGILDKELYVLVELYLNGKRRIDVARENGTNNSTTIITFETRGLVKIYYNLIKEYILRPVYENPNDGISMDYCRAFMLRLDVRAFEGEENDHHLSRGAINPIRCYIQEQYFKMGLYPDIDDRHIGLMYSKPIYFADLQEVYFDIKENPIILKNIRNLGANKFKNIENTIRYYCNLVNGDPDVKIVHDKYHVPKINHYIQKEREE